MGVDELRELLSRFLIRFGTEKTMQDDIEVILESAGVSFEREYRLKPGPIDYLVDGHIGLECKVAGGNAEVFRQCRGYLACTEVAELLIVTKRASHSQVPATLGGKPVRVLWVAGSAL